MFNHCRTIKFNRVVANSLANSAGLDRTPQYAALIYGHIHFIRIGKAFGHKYGTPEGTCLFQYLPEKKLKQKELEKKSKQ